MIHNILVLSGEARQFALARQVLFPPNNVLPLRGIKLGDDNPLQGDNEENKDATYSGSQGGRRIRLGQN
jgi:hypothetical protein